MSPDEDTAIIVDDITPLKNEMINFGIAKQDLNKEKEEFNV